MMTIQMLVYQGNTLLENAHSIDKICLRILGRILHVFNTLEIASCLNPDL
jgi:hypothetical protein